MTLINMFCPVLLEMCLQFDDGPDDDVIVESARA